MGKLTEFRPGTFEYVDDGGGVLRIERAIPRSKSGFVAIKATSGRPYIWVDPEDVEKIVDAIRDAARPKCHHCNGKGHL